MEAPEDLSKVEWGAGLAKLIESEYPNLIFFIVGFSLLALPSYLFSGIHEHELSHGSDTVFPIVLSIVLLFFAALMFLRLRAALLARGSVRPTIRTSDVGVMAMNAPMIQNMSRSSEPSWQRALGLGLTSVGTLWLVEAAALWSSTLGVVGFGWAAGLTTFARTQSPTRAANPAVARLLARMLRVLARAWGGTYRTPSHLPPVYFSLLLAALLFSVLGPALWFVLWKIIRQAVRPARVRMRTDDGLRELPQTAMFALAVSVGIIAGGGMGLPPDDRFGPQRLLLPGVPLKAALLLRREPAYTAARTRSAITPHHHLARHRRFNRRLPRAKLGAGGKGSWCA